MALLANLPPQHPLRNLPLLEIGAKFKHRGHKNWKDVTPNMNISRCTYNQLDSVWTDNDDWSAYDPDHQE